MTLSPLALTVAAYLVALFFPSTANSRALDQGSGTIACSQIADLTLPGLQILTIKTAEGHNVSGLYDEVDGTLSVANATGLNFCNVNVTYTHPGVNDSITTEIYLPLSGWNGRFLATGGGGDIAGYLSPALGVAVGLGYSAASTDGGVISLDSLTPLPKVFSSPGQTNLGLLDDFSARALHEMVVIGKAVTNKFFGQAPHHSYWIGCSTGGRQGQMMAQRYPTDLDGILANAPAVYWQNLMNVLFWPILVMTTSNTTVPQCVFSAFLNASIAFCDPQDGLVDGIIDDPHHCFFNPDTVVGQSVTCSGENVVVTQAMADVVRQIHDGPHGTSGLHLWDGYEWGAPSYGTLANTTTIDGHLEIVPWPLGTTWITWFEMRNPTFDPLKITLSEYIDNWLAGWTAYGGIIGTSDPDLSAFRDNGGKMITWQGLADQLIPFNDTVYYRQQIEAIMGGYDAVNEFYRFFASGGANHCGGGNGPVPVNDLQALVAWVENGTVPASLSGSYTNINGSMATRPICLWPQVAKYDGKGDQTLATSYACSASF